MTTVRSTLLTDAFIRRLPLPKERLHFFDSELGGFYVRIGPSGHCAFGLFYRVKASGGFQRRYTIGSFPTWTTKMARAEARRLRRCVDRGDDPRADIQRRNSSAQTKAPKAGVRRNFTELGVSAYKAPTDRQFDTYYDAIQPGLLLRVNSGGKKSWCVLYYVPTIAKSGKKAGQRISMPTTHKLGLYPHLKLKEARERARQFLADPNQAANIEVEMSVRKRVWTTRKGEEKTAWVVDYADQNGNRHLETFGRKQDAEAREAAIRVEVSIGTYIAPSRWQRWQNTKIRDLAAVRQRIREMEAKGITVELSDIARKWIADQQRAEQQHAHAEQRRHCDEGPRQVKPETARRFAWHAERCRRDPEYAERIKAREKARAMRDRALLRAFKKLQRDLGITPRPLEEGSPTS